MAELRMLELTVNYKCYLNVIQMAQTMLLIQSYEGRTEISEENHQRISRETTCICI